MYVYGAVPPDATTVAVPVFAAPHATDVEVIVALIVELIVIVLPAEVAVGVEAHGSFEVITTVTTLLFPKLVDVNVVPVAPGTFTPLICHWYVGFVPPFVGLAVNVTLDPAQIAVVGAPVMVTLGVIVPPTVIVLPADVAVGVVTQGSFEVIITVTTLLFAKEVDVNVALVAPGTFTPLICHWYVGVVPPFVGFAVKVTLEPAQIEDAGAPVIATLGVIVPPTVIVLPAEVAVGVAAHGSFDVITTVTMSLFANVVEVNVALVAPFTLIPLICH